MLRYPNSLTAILCRTPQEAKYVLSLLKPTFGELIRLGDSHSFSLEEGLLVSEISLVKGLEFSNVLLWNPSRSNFRAHEISERNLLYVGISRAEENLCLTTWDRPSELLPAFSSPLLRAVAYDPEEDLA